MWAVIATLMTLTGSIYAIPQALKSIRHGSALGVSRYFLLIWMSDKILSLAYTMHTGDIALIIKYAVSSICVLIVIYYKFLKKERKHD
jgi:uncharacterized protein with PQ loop repeat